MTPNLYSVNWAAYGGMNGQTNVYQVKDITAAVQNLLNTGNLRIAFSNANFSDPCFGTQKGFAVSVTVNGNTYLYAGTENQIVDFTIPPINPKGLSSLEINDLQATLVNGGWPTPANNFLFSACTFTICNNAGLPFPPNAETSHWVAVDFYLSSSNSPTQHTSGFTRIGDQGIQINSLGPQGSMNPNGRMTVNVATLPNGLFDVARNLTGSRNLISSGPYYLYAQVRNLSGIIKPAEGAFSNAPFNIQIPT